MTIRLIALQSISVTNFGSSMFFDLKTNPQYWSFVNDIDSKNVQISNNKKLKKFSNKNSI